MQLLHIGSRVRERRDETLRVRHAAAVQPATQLALLPTRDRCHPRRVARMPLDQRERLQDGVVDPCRDLGALLQPYPLGLLHRQLPQPRSDDEYERTRHRARREEAAARPVPAEEDHRAGDQQDDAEPR